MNPYDLFITDLLRSCPNELVLDNGTGNGRFALRLASLGCEVVALDINLRLLRAAKDKTRKENVHVVLADMTHLPFASESFAKVICVHNLWCVPDYTKAVQEMRRTAHSDGIIVADHLNLLDPRNFADPAFYFVAVKTATGTGLYIWRTASAVLAPFQGASTDVYSVFKYEPLCIVKRARRFARRFVIRCTT